MTPTQTGYVIFAAGLGMMFGMLALDISQLMNWQDAFHPAFMAAVIGHIGAVLTSFAGGKLIPPDRPQWTDAERQVKRTIAANTGVVIDSTKEGSDNVATK